MAGQNLDALPDDSFQDPELGFGDPEIPLEQATPEKPPAAPDPPAPRPPAEVVALTDALHRANEQIAQLTEAAREAARVGPLEDRISALQQQLVASEKETEDLREKLDTEAARSYRLAQRRIPALNKEIEDANEQIRELERKAQKAELKAQSLEGRLQELSLPAPAADAPPDALRAEHARLSADLRRIGEAHELELSRHAARAERLSRENEDRLEEVMRQRGRIASLRERLQAIRRLAHEVATAPEAARGDLRAAIDRLADLPPEADAPDQPST